MAVAVSVELWYVVEERRQAVGAFSTGYMGFGNWKFLYGNFPKTVGIPKEQHQVEVRPEWIM